MQRAIDMTIRQVSFVFRKALIIQRNKFLSEIKKHQGVNSYWWQFVVSALQVKPLSLQFRDYNVISFNQRQL